ncbi:MAG: DUF2442 domain-containing protein [Chloroflexi bacterium]|nr:MAG: DUF2442 domain-containing protein [Chloroflexota bacterium]
MNSLGVVEISEARANEVRITEDMLVVGLADGRVLSVPLLWYPRLWYATPEERANVVLLGEGTILHWPDLDEDLSVTGLLLGKKSGESPESLQRWLDGRKHSDKHPPAERES